MALSAKLQDLSASLRRVWPLRRTWLFVAAVGFAATLAALWLPLWGMAIPAGLLALSLAVRRFRRAVWLLLCGVMLLFWSAAAGYQGRVVRPLEQTAGKTDTLSGYVESVPFAGGYILRVTDSGCVPAGSRLLLYCADLYAPALYDTVTAEVTLSLPDAGLNGYRAQGVHLTADLAGFDKHLTVTGRVPASRIPWPERLRERLVRSVTARLPGDEGALITAMCLGLKQALPQRVSEAFRQSGLSHLLVVSGLHLSLVTGSVLWLLRRLRLSRRAAAAVAMPFVLLYMLLVGLSAPVLRAGVMCLVWLAGRLLFRRADGMNSLGLAAAMLLLGNPYMAVSPSFLLSFSATAGVLCLSPRLYAAVAWEPASSGWVARGAGRIYRAVTGSLAACSGALIPLMPLLCIFFGGFPAVTPLANLLVALPSSGVLFAGWAGLLLCAVPGLGFLGEGVLTVAGFCARVAVTLATWCSQRPLFIPVSAVWSLLLVIGLCLCLAVAVIKGRSVMRRRLMAGVLAVVLVTLTAHGVLVRRVTTLTVSADEDSAAVLAHCGDEYALLVTHSDRLAAAAELVEQAGCPRVAFLLLGEGDSADGGVLAQLLRTVEVAGIYAPDGATWAYGCDRRIIRLTEGTSLSVTELTVTAADGAWLWRSADSHLLLCPSGMPPGITADWAIFTGSLPEAATLSGVRQGILLGADTPPEATDTLPAALLSYPQDHITLATDGDGEWSIRPWS